MIRCKFSCPSDDSFLAVHTAFLYLFLYLFSVRQAQRSLLFILPDLYDSDKLQRRELLWLSHCHKPHPSPALLMDEFQFAQMMRIAETILTLCKGQVGSPMVMHGVPWKSGRMPPEAMPFCLRCES